MSRYYNVYLASPFFKEEQVERVEFIETLLTKLGYSVFSPRKEFVVKPNADKLDRTKGFHGNCNAINNCDFVLAVTDGKDMGTIWEAGYAYAKNKPILYFAETLGNNDFNLMLAESCKLGVCKNRNELETSLLNITKACCLDCYSDTITGYTGEIE